MQGTPPSVAARTALGVLDDEAVLGEYPQVIAGHAAGLADSRSQAGRGRWPVVLQQLQQSDPHWMDQTAQPARRERSIVRLLHAVTLERRILFAKFSLQLTAAQRHSTRFARWRGELSSGA